MTEPLRFIEPRVDFLDPRTGKISRQWYLFFQGLYVRVGGAKGFGTDDLTLSMPDDAGVEEMRADVYTLRDEVRSTPQPDATMPADDIQQLSAELSELKALVAELTKLVSGMQQSSTSL